MLQGKRHFLELPSAILIIRKHIVTCAGGGKQDDFSCLSRLVRLQKGVFEGFGCGYGRGFSCILFSLNKTLYLLRRFSDKDDRPGVFYACLGKCLKTAPLVRTPGNKYDR